MEVPNTNSSANPPQTDPRIALFVLTQASELVFYTLDAFAASVFSYLQDRQLNTYYVRLLAIIKVLLDRDDFSNLDDIFPKVIPASLLEDFSFYDQEIWIVIVAEMQNFYASVERECILKGTHSMHIEPSSMEDIYLKEMSAFFDETSSYIKNFKAHALEQKQAFLASHSSTTPMTGGSEPKILPEIQLNEKDLVVKFSQKVTVNFGSKKTRPCRFLQLVINNKLRPLALEEIVLYCWPGSTSDSKLLDPMTRTLRINKIISGYIDALQRGNKLNKMITFQINEDTKMLHSRMK